MAAAIVVAAAEMPSEKICAFIVKLLIIASDAIGCL